MSSITATYRVHAPASEIEAIARAIALEQSVEVPMAAVHDRYVAEEIVARVVDIRADDDGSHAVRIALATITTGGDVAQLVNMLFGNTSMHAHVELVDVAFPDDLLALFPGPRFGATGLRQVLGVRDRALTCAALKPQGLPVERLAALCYTFAMAGIDVIKDDHGLADQTYSPFDSRVEACQRAIERAAADSGHRAIYAPSIVGSPRRASAQIRRARDVGAGAVLLAPSLLGLPSFAEMVREEVDVPVLAHPSFTGGTRVAPPLLMGTLFRLLGADAVIFPHFASRFAFSAPVCADIVARGRAALGRCAPTMPVPAGGVQLDAVQTALDFYGPEVMLLIGGSLLIQADGVQARAERFVAAVRDAAAGSRAAAAVAG
jgi:ribulose-bisphosphate carboxylase large chain